MVKGEGEVQEDLITEVSQLCVLDVVVYLLFDSFILVTIRSKEEQLTATTDTAKMMKTRPMD